MADEREIKLDDLLMAYELGLLTEEERRQLEIYLMENDELMAEAGNFEEAVRLLKHDPDVRKLVAELESGQEVTATETKEKSRIMKFIPVFAAAAIFLIILLVQPWEIKIHPTNEVVAAENRLAIGPFVNMADPEDTKRLGEICSSLLISDLAESDYLQIVPLRTIADSTLFSAGNRDSSRVQDELIEQARKIGARWVLTGAILKEEPAVVISIRITEIATGSVVDSTAITGKKGEEVFTLIDSLAVLIKEKLTLPQKALNESGRPVADFTTHSQKAYFYFIEGKDQYTSAYYDDARDSFKRALAYDSTFAMVHYYLARLTRGEEKQYHIEQAQKYSDRTGTKEKFLIYAYSEAAKRQFRRAIELLELASLRFPDDKRIYYELSAYSCGVLRYRETVDYSRKAIEIDPDFAVAYNYLAYGYNYLGEVDSALTAVDQYIRLMPDKANPYDTKGDICMQNGMLDEAIASFEKSLSIKPDFYNSMIYLDMLYIFKGDYDIARATINRIMDSPSKMNRSTARSLLAALYLRQGQFGEAFDKLEQGIEIDKQEQTGDAFETEIVYKYLIRAYMYLETGDKTEAVRAAKEIVELFDKYMPGNADRWREFYAQVLAEGGNLARADSVAEALKHDLDSVKVVPYQYYYAAGAIDFARGDFDAAVEDFRQVTDINTGFYAGFMLARSLQMSGRTQEAIEAYEPLLKKYNHCWPLYFGVWGVKQYYYLGLACEEVGRTEDAAKYYKRFVDLWKDTDRPSADREDALKRLHRLENIQ